MSLRVGRNRSTLHVGRQLVKCHHWQFPQNAANFCHTRGLLRPCMPASTIYIPPPCMAIGCNYKICNNFSLHGVEQKVFYSHKHIFNIVSILPFFAQNMSSVLARSKQIKYLCKLCIVAAVVDFLHKMYDNDSSFCTKCITTTCPAPCKNVTSIYLTGRIYKQV